MTTRDRKYFAQKFSALRKAMSELEDELGAVIAPNLPRPKTTLQNHFDANYSSGRVTKPPQLNRKRTKTISSQ